MELNRSRREPYRTSLTVPGWSIRTIYSRWDIFYCGHENPSSSSLWYGSQYCRLSWCMEADRTHLFEVLYRSNKSWLDKLPYYLVEGVWNLASGFDRKCIRFIQYNTNPKGISSDVSFTWIGDSLSVFLIDWAQIKWYGMYMYYVDERWQRTQ